MKLGISTTGSFVFPHGTQNAEGSGFRVAICASGPGSLGWLQQLHPRDPISNRCKAWGARSASQDSDLNPQPGPFQPKTHNFANSATENVETAAGG